MSKNENEKIIKERMGTVGGQAVLEGVMMKAKNKVALSVRRESGNIVTEVTESTSIREKHKFFKLPLVRGVTSFVESMILSFNTLTRSADLLGIEADEESKFEKWLDEHFGKSIATIASVLGTVIGVALSVLLFFYLPALLSDLVLGSEPPKLLKSVFEGVIKIVIFLAYVALVSLIPDIKRTFEYHGAEHKSVFCHEYGLPLDVENVKKMSRFHPRCGTSFLVVMMVIGILVSMLYIGLPRLPRVLCKLVTLPIVVGLGFEFIMYAGKHDNIVTRILSAPGLWVQRITTKEPDDKQIEVAIRSLKAALPDIYPEVKDEIAESINAECDIENERSAKDAVDTEEKE